jgi:molecular chaperone IbpA
MQLKCLKKLKETAMTNYAILGPGFKDFDKFFVGFEDQVNHMTKLHQDLTKNIPNYPPYNIRKTGENTYTIELAVAGFDKSEIEIELDEGKLIVRGNVQQDTSESNDFLFKGIANRAFTRAFAIDDQVEVKDAELFNGMLKVFLERLVPEKTAPKKIAVKSKGEKQFLAE